MQRNQNTTQPYPALSYTAPTYLYTHVAAQPNTVQADLTQLNGTQLNPTNNPIAKDRSSAAQRAPKVTQSPHYPTQVYTSPPNNMVRANLTELDTTQLSPTSNIQHPTHKPCQHPLTKQKK